MSVTSVRQYQWMSPHTGRTMRLRVAGHAGRLWVYVPSSGGDVHEFERYGMAEAIRPAVEDGRLRWISVDGSGPESLFHPGLDGPARIDAYAAFERYFKLELVPWLHRTFGEAPMAIVGASYGAFVAANLFLKLPETFPLACGLGGVYEMHHRLCGFNDDNVYFHTPLDFLPGMERPEHLEPLRRSEGFHLFAAEWDEWLPSSRRFAAALAAKGVPQRIDVWRAPADHHERWWCEQLRVFSRRVLE